MDVNSAFLKGWLKEEIYTKKPEGFECPKKEDYVLKLKKALYGFKQAPTAWYEYLEDYEDYEDYVQPFNIIIIIIIIFWRLCG